MLAERPTIFDRQVLPLDKAAFAKALAERYCFKNNPDMRQRMAGFAIKTRSVVVQSSDWVNCVMPYVWQHKDANSMKVITVQ